MKDVAVTHIGGPTALIEAAGSRILTDPTFDPPGRKYNFGWGTSSVKVSGPAIAASDVGPIDAILLTTTITTTTSTTPAARCCRPRASW